VGQHRIIMSRTWEDREPDVIKVALETSATTGEPFVTFTGYSSTWLTPDVIEQEFIPWLSHCVAESRRLSG
jgi:hypothetical protein